MKYKYLTIILIILVSISVKSQNVSPNHYIVKFTDKKNSIYTINNPENFLSKKAIDRRTKYDIKITESDIPVNKTYVDKLIELGAGVHLTSKWMNLAIIHTKNKELLDKIYKLPFVVKQEKKGKNIKPKSKKVKNKAISATHKALKKTKSVFDYGNAKKQIELHNAQFLHNEGFQGQGMVIAITDAGFYRVNKLPAFDSLWANKQILGVRDFVDKDTSVFDSDTHGMKVLSTIGANIPGQFVGTAPKASFWLLRTEQAASEYIIEEYNWIAAVEFADSVGVDLVNVSLGYTDFDDSLQNHSYKDMDGNSTPITIGADIAASKGILVVTSAGNEGFDKWQYISAPADADSTLSVGAVSSNGDYAYFSSKGPTFDGRVKPNVTAVGLGSVVQGTSGSVSTSNGTSFSGPIMTGMVTCLWQAHPELNNMEIIRLIEKSSDQYSSPDVYKGYGIPNFYVAHILANSSGFNEIKSNSFRVFPNPFDNNLNIALFTKEINFNEVINIRIYNVLGKKIYDKKVPKVNDFSHFITVNNIEKGIYIVELSSKNKTYQKTVIKI